MKCSSTYVFFLIQDLVYATETEDGENFRKRVKQVLDDQLDFVNKLEEKSHTGENHILENYDSKKEQGLEKLSAVELESIRKELTRQRDTMSRKLIRQTEINVRLEKERENVYRAIQEEGKTLIKKCNVLKRAGLILEYRIGLTKKDAKELEEREGSNSMRNNALIHKLSDDNPKTIVKKSVDLPFIEYKKNKVVRRPADNEQEMEEYETSKVQNQDIYNLLNRVEQNKKSNQDIDRLYNEAKSYSLSVAGYQVDFYDAEQAAQLHQRRVSI